MSTKLFTRTLAFVVGAALLPIFHVSGAADWKPRKNIEIVVPTSPGTGSDQTARLIQRVLAEKKLIETPVSVVNKPGGSTAIALNYLAQHPGDGHYLMIATIALLTASAVGTAKISHKDVTPLARLTTESVVFTVRADSPIQSAKELAERVRADPGELSVAFSNAFGSQNHIAAVQLFKGVGANASRMKTVVFNGSAESVTALLGGHVDVMTSTASAALPHFRAGRVRILAASAEQRLAGALSGIPTWKELGIAAVCGTWRSVIGPKGMSDEQIRYWDQVFARLVRLPEWKEEQDAKQLEYAYLNSSETRKLMDAEHADLVKLLTELGLVK